MIKKCTTCGANLFAETIFVRFKCPNCGELEIGRCEKCKNLNNKYKCSKCGFEGP